MSAKSIIISGIKNILILLIPAFIYFILTITRLDFIIYYYLSDTGILYEELYGSLLFLMYLFVLLHYIIKTISLFKQSQGFLSRIKILFFCLIIPVFMGFFIGVKSYFLIAGEDHFRFFYSSVNGYVYTEYIDFDSEDPDYSVLTTRTGKVLWQKEVSPFDIFMFQSKKDGEEYLCIAYKERDENGIRFDVVSPEEAKIMATIAVDIQNNSVGFSDIGVEDDKNAIFKFENDKIYEYEHLREENIGVSLFSIYFDKSSICSILELYNKIDYINDYSNWKVISDYKNIIGELNHSEDNHFKERDSNNNEDDSETEQSTSKIVVEHHGATQKWVPCNICNGSMECQNCHGLGYTGFTYQSECVSCNGFKKCTYCSGQGGHYETVYY